MQIEKVTDTQVPAEYVANKIISALNDGKKVLWLVPGGSAMAVAVEAVKIISKVEHGNLAVTLTDERYGALGHKDSNWAQLADKGFELKNARLLPVLSGKDIGTTTLDFNLMLSEEIKNSDFKIGLFGIGADGHTAGILPDSAAVNSTGYAASYSTFNFQRITMTPVAIEKLDTVVVYAQGQEKNMVLEKLKEDLSIQVQPAQVLKRVSDFIIFYKES